jgi:hypothetical protein
LATFGKKKISGSRELMAYRIDFSASAKRHWLDAEMLLKSKRAQCAGYHYGYAAECVLKSVLYIHHLPRREDRRNDPYWAHFPELRTLLIRDGRGRLPQKLYQLIAQASFTQYWDTDIRYATDHAVDEDRANLWRKQAETIFGIIFY